MKTMNYEMMYKQYGRFGEGAMVVETFNAPSDKIAILVASPVTDFFGIEVGQFDITEGSIAELEDALSRDLSEMVQDYIVSENGDCDYLYYLKNVTTGETIFQAFEISERRTNRDYSNIPEEFLNL